MSDDQLDQLLGIWDEHGSMAAYAQLKRFITADKIKAAEQDRPHIDEVFKPSLELKLAQVYADDQGMRLPDLGEDTRAAIRAVVDCTEPLGADGCIHSWAKIDGEWRCRHCPKTSVVNPLLDKT